MPSGTLAKAFANIVKDAEARAVLLAGLAVQANSLLQQAAAAAGDQPDLDQAMSDYFAIRGEASGAWFTNEEGDQRSRSVGRELHPVSRPSWRRRRSLVGLFVSCVLASALVACKSGNDESGPDLKAQSMQATEKLRAAAQELGRESEATAGKPSKEAIWKYLDVVARTAALFGGPLLVSDSSTQPKVTPKVVAGLELTVVEVAKGLSGGLKYPDPTTQHAFEAFDARSEEKRLQG